MDPDEREGWENLGGVEGGETTIKIRYVRNFSIFKKSKNVI